MLKLMEDSARNNVSGKMSKKSLMLLSAMLVSILLLAANSANATTVSINYSGVVYSVADTGSNSPISLGEPVTGSIIIDTVDLFSSTGDAAHMDYVYSGASTYGSFNTVNNGSIGSSSAFIGIDNNIVLGSGTMIDDYYVGGFSSDFVWDNVLNTPVSGMQFALRLAFPSNALNSTELDFNTLFNLSNPIHTEIWMAGYGGSGLTFEALASLDSMNVTISSVPVPAAVWLFASGLLGLVGFARRKH